MGQVAELRGLVRGSDFGRAAQGDRLEAAQYPATNLDDRLAPAESGRRGLFDRHRAAARHDRAAARSEEHTSELQSLMRISYAVFCLKKKNIKIKIHYTRHTREESNYKSHITHKSTHS